MSTEPRLANFFVIGANRAGTTSLHEYLGQHPAVYMSPVKEPNYFAPKGEEDRALWPDHAQPVTTLEQYQALFAGVTTETAIGESSTVYLASEAAPRLVHAAVPDAKLVVMLHDPAERAFSDYCLHRSWGTEPLSFADAVVAELDHDGPVDGRMRGYVRTGLYSRYLSRWLEHFARAQLRVHLYEELTDDATAMMSDLFAFLGVDPSFVVRTTVRRNASKYEPKHATVDRVMRASMVRSVARKVVPERAWVWTREFVRRTNSVPPEFPGDVRRRLVDFYRDDIERTAEIIGRDLSAWMH